MNDMPGTVFELTLEDARALVVASAADPDFPWFASNVDRQMLLQEARRVVEHYAHEAACRLTPAREPHLKIVR